MVRIRVNKRVKALENRAGSVCACILALATVPRRARAESGKHFFGQKPSLPRVQSTVASMASILRLARSQTLLRPLQRIRWSSNDVPHLDPSTLINAPGVEQPDLQSWNGGALRPHHNVEVRSDHPLYAFFRQKEKDGELQYETLEPRDDRGRDTGRSWKAAELRRKSFKDIHTLWYVLLRERNLLATQREEARRLGIQNAGYLAGNKKLHQCRKSMARIKYVLNERRLLYESHMNALAEQQAAETREKEGETPRLTRAERMKARRG